MMSILNTHAVWDDIQDCASEDTVCLTLWMRSMYCPTYWDTPYGSTGQDTEKTSVLIPTG